MLRAAHVGQGHTDQFTVKGVSAEFGNCQNPVECAFQFTDVGGHLTRDLFQHFHRHRFSCPLCFCGKDGDAGLQIRRLDINGKPPFKTGAHPFIQCSHSFWCPVGGDDDLLVHLVQLVESMEKGFLSAFLADNELDIIDQQHVCRAVLFPESFIITVLNGADKIIGELFG